MSIVTYEAWLQGTPVVVNGNCEVTKRLCDRSGGGVYYYSKASFQAFLHWLKLNPSEAKLPGTSGYQYVKESCDWKDISKNLMQIGQSN
jgi:hypothetical protein